MVRSTTYDAGDPGSNPGPALGTQGNVTVWMLTTNYDAPRCYYPAMLTFATKKLSTAQKDKMRKPISPFVRAVLIELSWLKLELCHLTKRFSLQWYTTPTLLFPPISPPKARLKFVTYSVNLGRQPRERAVKPRLPPPRKHGPSSKLCQLRQF